MGFRKLVILFISSILLFSCKVKSPPPGFIRDCYVEENKLILNLAYQEYYGTVDDFRIGKNGACLSNVTCIRNMDTIKIIADIETFYEKYEENKSYEIVARWIGGYIEADGLFKDGHFEIYNEKYFNKGPF